MAVVDRGVPGQGSSFSVIVNDERYRSIFYQIIVFAVVMRVGWYLFRASENLEARGMSSGFDSWNGTGLYAFSILPYEAGDSYLWVYLVGITFSCRFSLLWRQPCWGFHRYIEAVQKLDGCSLPWYVESCEIRRCSCKFCSVSGCVLHSAKTKAECGRSRP